MDLNLNLKERKEDAMTLRAELSKSLAPTLELLNKLFAALNSEFFDSTLSKVIITLAPAKSRGTLGWCSRWEFWEDGAKEKYYEINVCADYLNRPFVEVAETLLHEMCHLYSNLNGIQDCSRSSQYHNSNFKDCAEKHGLNVEKMGSRGFAATSLKPETLEFIKSLNTSEFDLFRNAKSQSQPDEDEGNEPGTNPPIAKPTSTRKYICLKCGLSLRATKEIRVICEDCNERLVKAM